jgi:hypothetical protein
MMHNAATNQIHLEDNFSIVHAARLDARKSGASFPIADVQKCMLGRKNIRTADLVGGKRLLTWISEITLDRMTMPMKPNV